MNENDSAPKKKNSNRFGKFVDIQQVSDYGYNDTKSIMELGSEKKTIDSELSQNTFICLKGPFLTEILHG